MKNQPRRNHYVPEFYQRSFADTDKRLWLYDRRTQKYAKAHPRNICCEKELYTIDPNGTKNRCIELNWLSKVDGGGAAAIRLLERGCQLDQEWKESLSIFIAQQITRTPVFRDLTIRNYRRMAEEYLRIGFSDIDRARDFLETYRAQAGEPSEDAVTAESLVEAVSGGNLQLSVSEVPFLTHMVRQVEFLARRIAAFEWEIVRSPVGSTGFILSDYPFVVVPARAHPDAIGLGFPGTMKYFPLTRALCLNMGEPTFAFSYRNIDKEEVRMINQNIAVNSERFIMGPSQEQLAHVIARSSTIKTHPTPRTCVDVISQDRDSGLIRFTFWPNRRFFYSKTT